MPRSPFSEGRSYMVRPKRYSPAYSPVTGNAETSVTVSRMVGPLSHRKKDRQEAALAGWENEGGRVADTAPALPGAASKTGDAA